MNTNNKQCENVTVYIKLGYTCTTITCTRIELHVPEQIKRNAQSKINN